MVLDHSLQGTLQSPIYTNTSENQITQLIWTIWQKGEKTGRESEIASRRDNTY